MTRTFDRAFNRVLLGSAGVLRRLGRLGSRFRRNTKGATAVEFGALALPFFVMLMMIVEASMIFWTRQVLQEATSQAARTILTGEARTLYTGSPAAQTAAFRDAVCARMNIGADCATRLLIDVRPEAAFGPPGSMVAGGVLDPTQFAMRQTGPNEIVIIRTALRTPVFVTGYFSDISRLATGENVLESVVAYRTEPFPVP
jgi:Flp pilus assembly protein TadG